LQFPFGLGVVTTQRGNHLHALLKMYGDFNQLLGEVSQSFMAPKESKECHQLFARHGVQNESALSSSSYKQG
jgi:hypothetical protein